MEWQFLCVSSSHGTPCFLTNDNNIIDAHISFSLFSARTTTTTTCMQMDQWSQWLPAIFRHTHPTTTLGSASYMALHAHTDAVLYILHLCHLSHLRSRRRQRLLLRRQDHGILPTWSRQRNVICLIRLRITIFG